MTYEIVRGMVEVAADPGGSVKTQERCAMERLRVGDGFWVETHEAMLRARWSRSRLAPKKFSVRKVPRRGWQVRRIA